MASEFFSEPLGPSESDRQALYEPKARVLDADSYLRAARLLACKEFGISEENVQTWYEAVVMDEMSIDGFFDLLMQNVPKEAEPKILAILWSLRRAAGGGR